MFTTKIREKSIGKMRSMRLLAVLMVPVIALIMGAATPEASAFGFGDFCVVDLDEAEVFFEYNSTDEDRGIQFFWDGEPWKWMIVKNDRNRTVLNVIAQRNVKAQGLTEGFFESAEPEESDLSEAEFFARFPAGDYSFKGMTLDGCWLVGETELTHALPDPVDIELEYWPTINWTPTGGPAIVGYEVVVEMVIEEDGDERVFKETTTVPAILEQLTVSNEFVRLIGFYEGMDAIEELKVEILADEESGNRTITEVPVCPGEGGNACPEDD